MIVAEFRLEDVVPSPAFFDVKKLTAFNGEYVRALPGRRLRRRLPSRGCDRRSRRGRPTTSTRTCSRPSPRSSRPASTSLAEVPAYVDFLFLSRAADRRGSWAKAMKDGAAGVLDDTIAAYEVVDWDGRRRSRRRWTRSARRAG